MVSVKDINLLRPIRNKGFDDFITVFNNY